jgi:hypothetical protein
MKFNNVHEMLSTNLTNIHKCLAKILFFAPKWIKFKFRQKKRFSLAQKNIFSKHLWMLVNFRVHCWTSCKIRTPTDKNCGNESKIRLTLKIRRFTPIVLPPQIFYQKTREFWTPFLTFFRNFSTFSNYEVHDWTKEIVPI